MAMSEYELKVLDEEEELDQNNHTLIYLYLFIAD